MRIHNTIKPQPPLKLHQQNSEDQELDRNTQKQYC